MNITELAERKQTAARRALQIYEDGEKAAGGLTDDQRHEAEKLVVEAKEWADKMTQAIKDIEGRKAIDELMGDANKGESDSSGSKSADGKQAKRKTLGASFVESAGYKGWKRNVGGQTATAEISEHGFKATFTAAGSTLTNYDRQAGMVLIGTQRLTVADLLAQGRTNAPTVRYVKEDTFTNAADTVAEGATKPEASWDTSEVDAPVRKIAVTSKVTDELFADFPAISDYIDARMPLMVQLKEEQQLLSGDGVAPNILGILNTPGIQTQAKGADPSIDAVYKGMVKVMTVGFFNPDGVVLNPLDWQDMRLLRTADGIYIMGMPQDAGVTRLWDLPVVTTTSMTADTGLVGSFRLGAQVFYREGISVESTNSNEDDFKKNLIALRAEERLALAVYRPKAFCTVTGI